MKHDIETSGSTTSRRGLLAAAGAGTAALLASTTLLGSATPAAAAGADDTLVNVKDHGAVGNGTTDDLTAINAAIDAADAAGGGIVFFPPGKYRISGQLNLGNGSNTAVSTKHHRITLAGSGKGGSPSLNFVENDGATEIVYDGTTSTSAAVLSLEGPLHSVTVENMVLNANGKAGYGIRINHVTDSFFTKLMTRQPTVSGWILTSRTGFPPGCVYGCGNNVLLHCWAYDPGAGAHGLILTSGVSTSTTLTGNPDSANNDIIGGCFFYAGTAGTAGFYINGADNNTIYGAQAIPSGGTGGSSIYFEPWAGDTRFPLENAFHNVGMSQSIGGTSGTLGNTFTTFQEGDGATLPLMPSITALTHKGVQVVFGKRARRSRDHVVKTLASAATTTSTSYATAGALSAAVSGLIAGSSQLRIAFTGTGSKATSGTGTFVLAIDGVPIPSTAQQVSVAGSPGNLAMNALVDATAASHTVSVMFKSSNSNVLSALTGNLVVEELY